MLQQIGVAFAIFLLPSLLTIPRQNSDNVSSRQLPDGVITTITVRYLNGKNGKPMRDAHTNVWTLDDPGSKLSRLPGANGSDLILKFSQATPNEIGVMPNYLFDCRFKSDDLSGRSVRYSVDEIVAHGIVGVNLCGKITVPPAPGVLLLFVRPRTFRERWNL